MQTHTSNEHTNQNNAAPTKPYVAASVVALATGVIAYGIGLFNAEMLLNEKGYYLITMLYGLFAFVSLQKTIRDKMENIKVSSVYMNLCWLSAIVAIALLVIGLYNADLLLSEKGFYAMAYILSIFAAITVQKNIRDIDAAKPAIEADTSTYQQD